jgi:asparagine synthase (glutamine-hydrolysing)
MKREQKPDLQRQGAGSGRDKDDDRLSGFAAIVSRDGTPLRLEDLAPLEAGLACCGADGRSSWIEGPVGLAQARLWTTPEERGETQPVFGSGGLLALAADLRLDNRAELCAALGDVDERRATDAEILLAAYERWGETCPRHLVGDFAFALWDGRRRRLFCARDPIGMRPLYYALTASRLVIASTVEAILASLAATATPADINEPFLSDLVAWRFDRWREETPYRGVLRLPPAHQMLLEGKKLLLSQYWTFGAAPQPSLRGDEEYVERFREIFLAAVGSRLRSTGPVGFLLSGGLDSSAVACAAHHLEGPDLRFYTSVFAETPGAEEREYAEAIARHCPRARMTYIPSDDCWGLRELGGEDGYPQAEPEVAITRALVLRPLQQARRDGCRIALAGIGGDQVLSGEPYHKPFELRDVEARRVLTELPHFRRYSRRSTAGLLLDAWLRPAVRRLARRTDHHPSSAPPLPTLAAQESFRYLTEGTFSAKLAALRIAADHTGIEVRIPFLDRRVIDFLLTVPARVRFRDGMIKWILRESMGDILPEKVRRRTSLAHFSELQHRGLRDRARSRVLSLLAGSRVVGFGMASADALRAEWEAYWASSERLASPPHRLIGFLCAESWLRSREGAPVAGWESISAFGGEPKGVTNV